MDPVEKKEKGINLVTETVMKEKKYAFLLDSSFNSYLGYCLPNTNSTHPPFPNRILDPSNADASSVVIPSCEIRQMVNIDCAIGFQIDAQDPALADVVSEIGEKISTQ